MIAGLEFALSTQTKIFCSNNNKKGEGKWE